jgi:spermidine synthase
VRPKEAVLTSPSRHRVLFALFFVSGFCGLLYQVVWLRLAFASFGIIAPVLSAVVSVFMLGLGVGSWAGGKAIAPMTRKTGLSSAIFYALAELMIGVGAFVVPRLFQAGEAMLLRLGESNSVSYLVLSAAAIALSILPWTIFMGTTFPFMMAFVEESDGSGAKSFSFLYTANVFGATFGAVLTATVLIEMLGFRHTLWLAGAANVSVAATAMLLGRQTARRAAAGQPPAAPVRATRPARFIFLVLFTTGFASLAMEVVWTRALTPVLGTQVYSFASLLSVYLLATWAGSSLYRLDLQRGHVRPIADVLALVAMTVLLPVVMNDPRLTRDSAERIVLALASIVPFSAVLGYLTPRLVDDVSGGDPGAAGKAYALNVLGCILGPLVAAYALLPLGGATRSLVILAAPLLLFALSSSRGLAPVRRWSGGLVAGALLCSALFVNVSHENPCRARSRHCRVLRDYTATVTARGDGLQKELLVNGIGITSLTPITKYMAALPVAFHRGTPQSALTICFGMGTTYRSLLKTGLETTAVELVPSVRDAFWYFYDDAPAILRDPRGRIVIDDGRRYLNRVRDAFDLIVVDPPPPVEAAGSSLLYSDEFHEAIREHLKPNGIFQTWFPGGEARILAALTRSLVHTFPHVRAYASVEGWGVHFLASMSPLDAPTVAGAMARLPGAARDDLVEWSHRGLERDLAGVLSSEIPISSLERDVGAKLTDDRPYNEYFLVRRLLRGTPQAHTPS